MNDLFFLIIVFIFMINAAIGLGYMYVRYEENFTILNGVKTLLFYPFWFLFPIIKNAKENYNEKNK